MRTELNPAADYLAEQARGLAGLAEGAGFTALAYIFSMAELEALSIAAANERLPVTG